jgi:hypothetical protein
MAYTLTEIPFTFYNQSLIAYQLGRECFAPLKDLCTVLGLSEAAERRRIENDEVIKESLINLPITNGKAWRRPALPGLFGRSTDAKLRAGKVTCLNVKILPYWIALLDSNHIRPELKQSILSDKRHLVDVTWTVFRRDIFGL